MSDTREFTDPFTGKVVAIENSLTDRLRGKYAVGPTMPDGEPEFGYRQHQTPPIQHEAAAEIERLRSSPLQQEIALLKAENKALRERLIEERGKL